MGLTWVFALLGSQHETKTGPGDGLTDMKNPYSNFRRFYQIWQSGVLFHWHAHQDPFHCIYQTTQTIMMIGRLLARSAARAATRPAIASSFRAQAVRALASSTSPLLSEATAGT